jgi:hypothetical protein
MTGLDRALLLCSTPEQEAICRAWFGVMLYMFPLSSVPKELSEACEALRPFMPAGS